MLKSECNYLIYSLLFAFLLSSCNFINLKGKKIEKGAIFIEKDSIYTPYSTYTNQYQGFNSVDAINAIAKIENRYFNDYRKGVANYYGTTWYETVMMELDSAGESLKWNQYLQKMHARKVKPDSFHCTIYAIKALQAGFGNEFSKVQKLHQQHWNNREYAGWSIAYILTRYYNWKAYLIINEQSEEYDRCIRNFKNKKEYYVWRQPNIQLENLFIMGEEEAKIDRLLAENEFGWGFSYQGIHTWITRYNQLKECRWEGAPGKAFDYCDGCSPLFITHDFSYYTDYISHVVVFPPKRKN